MGYETLIFDNMEQATPQEVECLLRFVSDQRREEALKYKHLAGQYACLKSYELLHTLMQAHGLINSKEKLFFIRNQHGKPSLEGRNDIFFNISHCSHAIAVAISSKPIGIDVEKFRTPTSQLLNYTMNEEECAQINESDHPDQQFTILWTQKESLFKYYGTGITHGVRDLLANKKDNIVLHSELNIEKKYALTICESI